MVEVRFFAAARAAVGSSTLSVPAGTLDSVLAEFDSPVISRCTFLVNGIAATVRSIMLVDGDQVDVLPPFAGG
jgi:molybdopterin synthase sulfur carrier subunit